MAISLSSASPPSSVGADRKITLSLPTQVVRALKTRMVAEDTTMRALILEALAATGYDVAADEIRDRRRR